MIAESISKGKSRTLIATTQNIGDNMHCIKFRIIFWFDK